MSKKKVGNPEELTGTENIMRLVPPQMQIEPEEFEMQPDPADALRAELATEKDRYIRLAAEYDNYRKRSQKERDAIFSDVKADTVSKILPIYDSISRALRDTLRGRGILQGCRNDNGTA